MTELVGYLPAEDYEFTHSKALANNIFMGLGIDEYHQDDKTDDRIRKWLAQLQQEFASSVYSVTRGS